MQLKGTDVIHVDYTSAGKIAVEQWCEDSKEPMFVYMTLDQFRTISKWIDKNYLDIVGAWNDGVDDE